MTESKFTKEIRFAQTLLLEQTPDSLFPSPTFFFFFFNKNQKDMTMVIRTLRMCDPRSQELDLVL